MNLANVSPFTVANATYGPAFAAAFEAGLANNVGSAAVPEPTALASAAVGLTVLLGRRRLRN